MPIDVATGVVSLTRVDVRVPGFVPLTWERRYSSAPSDPPTAPLGPGWAVRYFASLTPTAGGYRLFTPEGASYLFEDPEGRVARGRVLRDLGGFQELKTERGRLVLVRWDVDTGVVERFVFDAESPGRSGRLVAIEDVIGRGLDLEYDRAGRLARVVQRVERRALELAYLSNGMLGGVEFRAADGTREPVVRYSYDGGRLTGVVDESGHTDGYRYGPDGRLGREEAKDGGAFTYTYDDKGRCAKFSGAGRYNEKSFRYVEAARLTYVTNSTGNTSVYEYLPTGQVVRWVNPVGGETRTEYDEHARVVAKVAPGGGVTRYTYDDAGNRSSITDPLGHGYTFLHNDAHLGTTLVNPNGHVWVREYDARNRLTASVDPQGRRWAFAYTADGFTEAVTDPLGHRVRQRYQGGQLVEWTDWAGNPTRFEYDRRGRLVGWTDPVGARVALRLDPAGHPVEVRWPDETTTRATYDAGGNLTSHTDAAGRTTRYRFAPCGRILEQVNPDDTRVEYLWETEPDRLAGVINEYGEVLTLARDAAGRVVQETGFDGRETRFEYDPAGNCVAVTNGNGERIVREYDPARRLTAVRLPDGTASEYQYDPSGRIVAAGNADIAVAVEYDPSGRIVRQTQGEHWVATEYNPAGAVARTSTSLGHEVRSDTDPNGRIVRLTTAGQQIGFGRDRRGAETVRTLPGGAEFTRRYDPLGRLIDQAARSGAGEELVHRVYRRESTGAVRAIEDSHWGGAEFSYDPTDHLRQALRPLGASEQFEYDPAGNLTHVRRAGPRPADVDIPHRPGNRIERAADATYQYDAQGRVVRMTRGGGERPAEVWEYVWNAHDQLRSVTRPDGERWEYKYDPFGRRVEKLGPGRRTAFVWDHEVVIHTIDGPEDVTSWVTDPRKFTPYAKVRNGKVFSVVADHLGTPRELIGPDGAVAWRASLLAWGEVDREELTDPDADCPIRFQGQWHDAETGLHYNWHRYYDPRVGAYLCQDPIRLAGGLNPYQYTVNPVNGIDPFGLICHRDTNGGEGYVIYAIVDRDGNVVYVGITNNFDTRCSQHSEPGGRLDPNHPDAQHREMVPIDHAETYGQARGFEQAYIELTGTRDTSVAGTRAADNPSNRCNSFDPDRGTRSRDPARDRAFQQARRDKLAEYNAL
jgi:RHS repeat-associated protein